MEAKINQAKDKLFQAVKNGNLTEVTRLLDNHGLLGLDIDKKEFVNQLNEEGNNKYSLLYYAAKQYNEKARNIRKHNEKARNISKDNNVTLKKEDTNEYKILELLLANGADITKGFGKSISTGNQERAAIAYCMERGMLFAAKFFIEKGSNPCEGKPFDSFTLLTTWSDKAYFSSTNTTTKTEYLFNKSELADIFESVIESFPDDKSCQRVLFAIDQIIGGSRLVGYVIHHKLEKAKIFIAKNAVIYPEHQVPLQSANDKERSVNITVNHANELLNSLSAGSEAYTSLSANLSTFKAREDSVKEKPSTSTENSTSTEAAAKSKSK